MAGKLTDINIKAINLEFLPVHTRVPLKFGSETLNHVTCARAKVTVEDRSGNCGIGWGETPLSVQWVWPSELSYSERYNAIVTYCELLSKELLDLNAGHPIESVSDFIEHRLHELLRRHNQDNQTTMPYLAALVATSVFDQAIHDAFGNLHQVDTYKTYNSTFMNRDLGDLLPPDPNLESDFDFHGRFPEDFLVSHPPKRLPVWHLVGGLDPISENELNGDEPDDDYPVLLKDWIEKDGLDCLKIKLRGNDSEWDLNRMVQIGQLGGEMGVKWLSADFNCMVQDPAYVNQILDQIQSDFPAIWKMILYVEQPFPHDLKANQMDVYSVSQRKPLFLDESAHDWKYVRLGRKLGWTGVALKTCKTQTGALLGLCWAKAHEMPLMVQDLTNPMLAMIPHVRLAAHAGTIMGVECNAMQFYPQASQAEEAIHPGIYQRRNGVVDLSTLGKIGFGHRLFDTEP